MTVRIEKPAINLREKLTELELPNHGKLNVDGDGNLTVRGDVVATGDVSATGGTITGLSALGVAGNATFGDNDKAIFGAGSDLQIFHTGSYSAIRDVGTGGLFIGGENYVDIGNAGASATYARFHKDAQVDLYHNNAIKLTTTSTGVDVTGTVTADGLTVDGDVLLSDDGNYTDQTVKISTGALTVGNKSILAFADQRGTETSKIIGYNSAYGSGLSKAVEVNVDGLTVARFYDGGDISFYEDTGTTPKFFWDASAEALGIGTSSPSVPLDVTGTGAAALARFNFGDTNGGYITFATNGTTKGYLGSAYHLISGGSANDIALRSEAALAFSTSGGTERLRIDSSGNVGIGTSSPQAKLQVLDALKVSTTDQSSGSVILGDGGSTAFGVGIARWNGATNAAGAGGVGYFAQGSINAGGHFFYTGDAAAGSTTERMRIDASGNVGIGTSSPSYPLDVASSSGSGTTLRFYNSGNGGTTHGVVNAFSVDSNGSRVGFGNNAYPSAQYSFDVSRIDTSKSGWAWSSYVLKSTYQSQSAMTLQYVDAAGSQAERLRIDASGNLLVGTTSATPNTVAGAVLKASGIVFSSATDAGSVFNRLISNGDIVQFRKDGTTVGSVSVTASATSYNTSSDYRLKEDVQPMVGASDRVLALKPVNFAWKADGSRVDGFLAHEAQEVVPEAVHGVKDGMRTEEYEVTPAVYEDVITPAVDAVLDEEGNVITEAQPERTESQLVSEAVMGTREVPDYQGIDQSKLVPLLTAALQEALTEIASLKARLDALEAK